MIRFGVLDSHRVQRVIFWHHNIGYLYSLSYLDSSSSRLWISSRSEDGNAVTSIRVKTAYVAACLAFNQKGASRVFFLWENKLLCLLQGAIAMEVQCCSSQVRYLYRSSQATPTKLRMIRMVYTDCRRAQLCPRYGSCR
jgi:hypothetical protein